MFVAPGWSRFTVTEFYFAGETGFDWRGMDSARNAFVGKNFHLEKFPKACGTT